MAAEGEAILAEGIAAQATDIDLVEIHGYGFPRRRGGPMHYAAARSEVGGDRRLLSPVVVEAVGVADRGGGELLRRHVVEGREPERDEGAADRGDVAAGEEMDAAGAAEEVGAQPVPKV